MIVIDIDGCLGPGKCIPFDLGALGEIRAWGAAHPEIPLVLCTGRSQPYAESVLQMIDAYHVGCPSVVENGCYLYYGHPTEDVVREHTALPDYATLHEIKSHLHAEIIVPGHGKSEPGKEACISLNPLGGMSTEKLHAMIEAVLSDSQRSLLTIHHSSTAVDITPRGIDKGSALALVAEETNTPLTGMIGIGDSDGDRPFLERVGRPACPANATAQIKDLVRSRGGYVAHEPAARGVAEILAHFYPV